jgi:DNA repair exonuclease SbcCD nuclease subunit
MHFKEHLGYYDHVEDARDGELSQILDFIVDNLSDCDKIVFLGDNFDKKNNQSMVIKRFIEFVERFNDKEVFILAGNHEKENFGRTAIDFLREIKGKNWHIITRDIQKFDNMVFVPFFTAKELELSSTKEASEHLVSEINKQGGEIIFAHLSLSGAMLNGLIDSSVLHEIVLPLEKINGTVIAGHIHSPQTILGKHIIVGSVFNNDANDNGKIILKIEDGVTTKIDLPGRRIVTVTDPTSKDLESIDRGNIIKAIFTKKTKETDDVKTILAEFDGHSIVRSFKERRKKSKLSGKNVLDMSIEETVKMYCSINEIEFSSIEKAFNLIKK